MRAIYLIISFFIFSHLSLGQDVNSYETNGNVKVFASNFCEHLSFPIVNKGDSLNGELPTFGFIAVNFFQIGDYYLIDSIRTERTVKELVIDPEASHPGFTKNVYLLDDSSLIVYKTYADYMSTPLAQFVPFDTISNYSNISARVNYDGNLHLISDNPASYLIFDSLSNLISTIALNFIPDKLEMVSNKVAITGTDTANNYKLYLFNLTNPVSPVFESDTILPLLASNCQTLKRGYSRLFMLSQPGDTMITFITINLQPFQIITTILYNNSPVRVADIIHETIYFQPLNDATGSQDNKKIFTYNSFSGLNTYNVNKTLNYLKGDQNSFIFFLVDSASPGVIEHYDNTFSYIDQKLTGKNPYLIESDFRCAVSIEEYNDEHVSVNAYPNPTTGDIKLDISGLICGKKYSLEIIDKSGRKVWQKEIEAKMELVLPFVEFSKGMYFINLKTKQGIKSVKVLKI